MTNPKIDKRVLMTLKGCKTNEKLEKFLQEFYKQAFEDGANADVDPDVNYIAIKKGTAYECGCCGAVLHLEDLKEGNND